MTKSKKQMIDIAATSAIEPSQWATFNLPLGRTYEGVFLRHDGNLTLDEMEGIRVRYNGKVIQEYESGTHLDKLNQHNKINADDGTWLPLYFTRPKMMTEAARQLTAIGTGIGDPQKNKNVCVSLAVEVKIATAAVGATLELKALTSAARPAGPLLKVYNRVHNPSSGKYNYSDIALNSIVNRAAWFNTHISDVTIKGDKEEIHELSSADNIRWLNDGDRKGQSGLYVYDPSAQGQGNLALDLTKFSSVEWILQMANSDTVTEYMEYIEPFQA